MLVHDVLLRAAARDRDGAAVLTESGRSISFGELAGSASDLAEAFATLGQPGDRIALVAENSPAWIECLYAASMAGRVLVPLNYRLSGAELAEQVRACGAIAVVGEVAQHERMASALADDGASPMAIRLDTADWPIRPTHPIGARAPISETDLAWLIFTSGTSGRAKGTMLTHQSLFAAMVANSLGRPIRSSDIYLSAYPLCHVSAMNIPLYHLHGRPIVLLRRFSGPAFVSSARRWAATTTTLAPTMLSAVLDELDATGVRLPALRRVGFGAAPMPPAVLARARDRLDVELTESYGMTELSGAVSFEGRPSPLALAQVCDESGQPVPVGTVGEIVVTGDQVAAGYWGEPVLSSATFVDGRLRTGDLGRYDGSGLLHIVGRLKDVIISGGENVMAREVEDALARHPDVATAAVIGLPDPYWGEAVCAFVVPLSGATIDVAGLDAFVADRLASFKRPRITHVVGELPLGPTGKVAKDDLRRWAAGIASTRPSQPDGNR